MAALAVLLIAAVWVVRSRPRAVDVVSPQPRQVVRALTVSGRISGLRESAVSPATPGILAEALVSEGESVAAGQALATTVAQVEGAEMARARAALGTARARLAETRKAGTAHGAVAQETEAEVAAQIEGAARRLETARARLAELEAGGTATMRQEARASVAQAATRLEQARRDALEARRLADTDATARSALETARAALASARARLAQAAAVSENAQREAQRAEELHAAGAIARSALDSARTAAETARQQREQAAAELDRATVEVERQERLYEVTARSAQQRAASGERIAQQELAAATARLQEVSSPARPEQLQQQRAEVAAARVELQRARKAGPARLRSVELEPVAERVAVARRAVQEAEEAWKVAAARLDQSVIRAQHPGTVTEIVSRPGDVVSSAQPVLRLSQIGEPEALVEVQEKDLTKIAIGQEAVLVADSHPDEPIPATVARIGSRVDPGRGTVEVTLRPQRRAPWLSSGMTVDATIILEPRAERLVLPASAILREDGRAYAVVVEDRKTRRLEITAGETTEGGVIILAGLGPGALVVTDPLEVADGSVVRPRERSPKEEALP